MRSLRVFLIHSPCCGVSHFFLFKANKKDYLVLSEVMCPWKMKFTCNLLIQWLYNTGKQWILESHFSGLKDLLLAGRLPALPCAFHALQYLASRGTSTVTSIQVLPLLYTRSLVLVTRLTYYTLGPFFFPFFHSERSEKKSDHAASWQRMPCDVLTPRSVNLPVEDKLLKHAMALGEWRKFLCKEGRERERESCYYQTVLLAITM